MVPVSLLAQWAGELATKTPQLKVYVFHGEGANESTRLSASDRDSGVTPAGRLASYDVVLTTMSKVQELARAGGAGAGGRLLQQVTWHRMVVDECQFLKNDTAVIARACSSIDVTHVWMLSGTPLTNKLDDLQGELSLLRIWPFTLGTSSDSEWLDHFWVGSIKEPWDAHESSALLIVQKLLAGVCLRHSRLQSRAKDGSLLVSLPPRSERFVAVDLPEHHSSQVCDAHAIFLYFTCFPPQAP